MTPRPRALLGISVTARQARALRVAGPRRDFFALRRAVGGRLFVQDERPPRGRLERWFGAHWRQAQRMAGRTREGDVAFADSEHLGIPLLVWLRLRRRRPDRVVILAHLPGRWWKRLALAVLTRLGPPGTLLLHSVEQQRRVAPWLGGRWRAVLVPYQVDTEFWTAASAIEKHDTPLILAVGSEHRDYETLARAVEGLPARVVIAAGSRWARRRAEVGAGAPENVTYLDETLGFSALREWYRRADIVVVPLVDVPNQSGVTTILEAMSVSRPVVVTASQGQRECVVGPLVTADGVDAAATADRGPHVLQGLDRAADAETTGFYVPPGDPLALRDALARLLADSVLRDALGDAGRRTARAAFPLARYVEEVAWALRVSPPVASAVPEPAP